MRELIRHILKENRAQQELKQVIEDGNIFDAADLVGGMNILKRIFKDDPEMSSLFEKLTGVITFYYSYVDGGHMKFPLDYEIIGRKSNNHKTNHWPEINVLYDENKLTPEENDTFKSMVKNLADDAQHSGFKSKFNDGRIFNANYLTVVELNGENIDSIWGGHYPWAYEVDEIHDKLYDLNESINESTFFRRRVDMRLMEKEFFETLNYVTDSFIYKLKKGIKFDFDTFKRRVINNLMDDYHNDLSDGGSKDFPYDEVYEFLSNHFHDKIKDRYDLILRRNINESVPSQVKRRQQIFDDIFVSKRNRLISCDYRTPEYLFNGILELTLEELYFGWFVDSVTYEEWEESVKYIESYLTKKYYNETSQMWKSKCKGRLYESEQSTSKKINIASNIIENEFSDVVRSIDVVEYFDTPTIIVKVETDDSAANVTIWLTEEMINTVSEITSGKVKLDYWFTGNKESEILLRVKKINGNNKLNESSIKEKSLINIIENEGLYDFIEMTGIDFNEVRSLLKHVDNPKEILKQYIREFVLEKGGVSGENYGSLFGLEIPLSNTKYVEDILVHDEDSIAIEIWEYHLDEYGHREQKDQYLTTINSLSNDELLTIVAWMMETIKGNYWD
jgi:hypothetical protein